MVTKNRPVGLLAALLNATEAGALAGLTKFSPQEIAPKLQPFLSAWPQGRQLSQSLWYATRKGFLATQERNGTITLALTYKGREHLLRLRRLDLTPVKPDEWDGQWRMITFDIPERRRYARDTFRISLKRIGFVKLESSLWIYPYECKKELEVIAEALLIKPHIRYFLVHSFDEEEKFMKMFNVTRV